MESFIKQHCAVKKTYDLIVDFAVTVLPLGLVIPE